MLARRVDVCKIDTVGTIECAYEIVKKSGGAAIGVRLICAKNALVAHFFGTRKRGIDFYGMMSVIVVNNGTIQDALAFHATVCANKIRKGFFNQVGGNAANARRSSCCQCVVNVVSAKYVQTNFTQTFFSSPKFEIGSAVFMANIARRIVGSLFNSKGYVTSFKFLQSKYAFCIVSVVKNRSILSCSTGVIEEGRANLFKALKIIGMVHSHIQNNRQRGVEIEEGIHIFAGFKNEVLLFIADIASRSPKQRELRSAKNGSIGGGKENLCTHCRATAFAVHTRNTNAVVIRHHQIAKIVGTGKKRFACRLCGKIFGVICTNGNGVDHGIVIFYIFGIVGWENGNALCFQLRGLHILGTIRSAYTITKRERNLRERRHTDATDSNKENTMAIF